MQIDVDLCIHIYIYIYMYVCMYIYIYVHEIANMHKTMCFTFCCFWISKA